MSIYIYIHLSCTDIVLGSGLLNSSLRGKHLYQVPADMLGNVEHVLALCDGERSYAKVVTHSNNLISL